MPLVGFEDIDVTEISERGFVRDDAGEADLPGAVEEAETY